MTEFLYFLGRFHVLLLHLPIGILLLAVVLEAASRLERFRHLAPALGAVWLLGAGLGVFALTSQPGWVAGVAAGLAVVAGLLFSLLFSISAQRVAADAIRVGEKLRDFSAIDEDRNEFLLATTAGKPVLLKFFRGHW